MMIHELMAHASVTKILTMLFFYAGPDQILPIVSVLGAIIGVLLIWWQRFTMLVRKAWKFLLRKSQTSPNKLQAPAKK